MLPYLPPDKGLELYNNTTCLMFQPSQPSQMFHYYGRMLHLRILILVEHWLGRYQALSNPVYLLLMSGRIV
jgi:hypothetical protein